MGHLVVLRICLIKKNDNYKKLVKKLVKKYFNR